MLAVLNLLKGRDLGGPELRASVIFIDPEVFLEAPAAADEKRVVRDPNELSSCFFGLMLIFKVCYDRDLNLLAAQRFGKHGELND